MEKLTKHQERVLNEIKRFIAKNGYAPTIRELCSICSLSSTATMFTHLKNLTTKGYINQSKNKFRTIELNVPNEYDDKNDTVVNVPLLGRVPAGSPIEAIEMPNDYFAFPKSTVPSRKEVFALVVKGQSMINKGIYDGDIVLVERSKEARNGEVVVALTEENEVTLKTFYKEKNYIRLQPENDTMEPIILPNVSILGKAIGLYRSI